MMEPSGVASAEEAKVENLADHLRIEITAAGTVCATPCCRTMTRRAADLRPGLAPLVVHEIYQLLSAVADGGIYASLAPALMIAVTLAVSILVFLFFRFAPGHLPSSAPPSI